jgi:glycosyltransferase involved in cell wall biosynthesis
VTGTANVLVSYSAGRGGGVERYVSTVEAAIRGCAGYARFDLHPREEDRPSPGPLAAVQREWSAHRRLASLLETHLRAARSPRLVLAYVNLLPAVLWAVRGDARARISVVLHGNEVWAPGLARRSVRGLLRRRQVRAVAVSSFTAGALYPLAPAVVLPPGLSPEWFGTLVAAGRAAPPVAPPTTTVMTSFRLESWRDKGFPELVQAVRGLGRPDVRVRLCGSGRIPGDLRDFVEAHRFCTLRAELTDAELAAEFAGADLFVLATRLRHRPTRSGEGFGLVLAEAQVAGTAVIGPAHGGGADAFRRGITGRSPVDESAAALGAVIREMIADRDELTRAGHAAARWAREQFDPVRYADLARGVLL